MFDTLIRGGTVIDGSGQPGYRADVSIKDGRIFAIDDIGNAEHCRTIDANGLYVTPGFIDIHTHSDFTHLVDSRAESQIRQGVTTEVIGQCGTSLAPCTDESRKAMFHKIGAADMGTWNSYAELLEVMESRAIATNVVGMVGHGALRETVMGLNQQRPATDEEITSMTELLEQSLETGAFGLTTGLEYNPGKMANYDEIAALCEVVSRMGGYYATHSRNRDTRYFVGFGEALDVARETGVRLQISHINPKYGRPENAMRNTIQMIEWSKEEGADVAMDMMPTNWNHTNAAALLPSWSFALPKGELFDLLKSYEGRNRLRKNPLPIWRLAVEEKWDKIRLLASSANANSLGRTIAEIAQERKTNGWDAVFDLILEEGDGYMGVFLTGEAFSESDNRLVLQSPLCAVASDTMALANDKALKKIRLGGFLGYNWVAKFIGHYLRDENVLRLEEGIRRLTSLPASRVGLNDRGRLVPGFAADVAIFDLDKVKDNSSSIDPCVYAGGFEYVFVNGVLAYSAGERVNKHSGKVLRRI